MWSNSKMRRRGESMECGVNSGCKWNKNTLCWHHIRKQAGSKSGAEWWDPENRVYLLSKKDLLMGMFCFLFNYFLRK